MLCSCKGLSCQSKEMTSDPVQQPGEARTHPAMGRKPYSTGWGEKPTHLTMETAKHGHRNQIRNCRTRGLRRTERRGTWENLWCGNCTLSASVNKHLCYSKKAHVVKPLYLWRTDTSQGNLRTLKMSKAGNAGMLRRLICGDMGEGTS